MQLPLILDRIAKDPQHAAMIDRMGTCVIYVHSQLGFRFLILYRRPRLAFLLTDSGAGFAYPRIFGSSSSCSNLLCFGIQVQPVIVWPVCHLI
jgi:hypothetical protein